MMKLYNPDEDVALVTKKDFHPFWHLRRSRDAEDQYLGIMDPLLGVTKGRPANVGGPFGQEPALPPAHRRNTQTTAPILAGARRIPSQHETGPTLDTLDDADDVEDSSHDCVMVAATVIDEVEAAPQAKKNVVVNKRVNGKKTQTRKAPAKRAPAKKTAPRKSTPPPHNQAG